MSVVHATMLSEGKGAVPISELNTLFANALSAVLGLAGIVLFIMLIVGGIKFVTSGGNPQALESARKTLTYAILGLVLASLAFLILVFIQEFTGAPVTVFNIRP